MGDLFTAILRCLARRLYEALGGQTYEQGHKDGVQWQKNEQEKAVDAVQKSVDSVPTDPRGASDILRDGDF